MLNTEVPDGHLASEPGLEVRGDISLVPLALRQAGAAGGQRAVAQPSSHSQGRDQQHQQHE